MEPNLNCAAQERDPDFGTWSVPSARTQSGLGGASIRIKSYQGFSQNAGGPPKGA